MKTLIWLALLPLFANVTVSEPTPTIYGDWLLRESYSSGCFSSSRQIHAPSEQILLRFARPNRYVSMKGDSLLGAGTFRATSEPLFSGKNVLQTFRLTTNVALSLTPNALSTTTYTLIGNQLEARTTTGTFSSGRLYERVR